MSVSSDDNRARLIGQAEHLIDELEALSSQVGRVPDEVLSASPLESEPSVKEVYALLGLYDRHVYKPALEKMVALRNPELSEGSDDELLSGRDWNTQAFSDVLSFARAARTELVGFLRALPEDEWDRGATAGDHNLNVYDVVYAITQHDAELLRTVAMRLHHSRLSGSPDESEGLDA